MDFEVSEEVPEYTEEDEKFRQEIRDFLDRELTPELREEFQTRWGMNYDSPPAEIEFFRKVEARGWTAPLAPLWPKEYGGVERSPAQKRIIKEELGPYGISWGRAAIQGSVILRYGTEDQKREFLPKLARGEMRCALGYTEPNAGTDLAALEMRAVRDGDNYIINGQKVYSTGAHISTHHWLAVRTNPNVPKHKGISLFMVDLKSPGVTIRPMMTMAGEFTNEVFYDDVRVPTTNLIGEEDRGWQYLRDALAVERGGISSIVNSDKVLSELIQFARETKHKGKRLGEDPFVRQSLAQLAIESSIRRLNGYCTRWLEDEGIISDLDAAIDKVWCHEFDQRLANTGMRMLGLYGQLQSGSKWAPLKGKVEHLYRFTVHLTYGGGGSEIMRVLIATRGMGLPRG